MNSILFIRKTFLLFLISLLTVFLSSCGGGDGGGDSSLKYFGSTEMAVITGDNAVELTLGAYYGGPAGYGDPSFVPSPINSTSALLQPQTIQTGREVVSGSCGGRATVTINIDDTNGYFTGTIQSDNYCENGITISGIIDFSGNLDLNTIEVKNITMQSNYLIKDNQTTKVYKVQNAVLSEVILTDRVEMSFDGGRYYHPDYGYVDLVSEQPFIQYLADLTPSSGQLRITGDQQTKALLTVSSINDVVVTADTDGDGIYEWSSGNLY